MDDRLVQGQQPATEHNQNQGDCCGFQKKTKTDIKPLYINGVGVGFPLPGSSHHKDLSWGVYKGELAKKTSFPVNPQEK